MKTKILKKILAATIATATITAIPGFASAVKKIQNKSKSCLKEENGGATDSKKKIYSIQKINKNKMVEEKKETKMLEEEKKNSELEEFDSLLNAPCQTSFEKQGLIEAVCDLTSKNLLKNYPKDRISKLVFKLCEFVDDKEVANSAADLINDLVCLKDWENLCSKDEILKIIDRLEVFAKNKDAEKNATDLINSLTLKNYWTKQCSKEEIFKILDVLDKFAFNCVDRSVLRNVVCAISNLMFENDFAKECYREKISKILYIFFECVGYEDAQEDVACAIDSFVSQGLFAGCSKDQSIQIMEILKDCTASNSLYFVSSAIFGLVSQGAFSKYDSSEVLKIMSMLNFCVSGGSLDGQEYVAKAIFDLAKKGLMDQIREDDVIDVTNLLTELCENGNVDFRSDAVDALMCLAQKGLMDGYFKEDMLKISNALAKCAADCENSKKHVSRCVLEFLNRNLLFAYSQEEIEKVANMLIFCATDQDSVRDLAEAVLVLDRKGFLKKFSKDEIFKLSEKLSKCFNVDEMSKKVVEDAVCVLSKINKS